MKVIKKGRPQTGWAKELACTGAGNEDGGCGAILLVEIDDVYETSSTFCGRDRTTYNTFKCPECGVETDIDENIKVPTKPRERVAIDSNVY